MKNFIYLIFFLLFCQFTMAQSVIHLEGHYQGPNLYLQNTPSDSLCVDSIKVNRKKLPINPSGTAIEIKLKGLGLNLGDEIVVQIYHKEGCKPKILYDNITTKRSFTLNSIELTADGNLIWEAICVDTLIFDIEQFRWNRWVKVGSVNSKGIGKSYKYKFKVGFHTGTNKFRITHTNNFGKKRYSQGVKISHNVKENEMVCTLHKDDITFMNETDYEIYDAKGKNILTGTATVIDISALKKGIYYLNYDNKTETFVKR